jgi:hypothetical protein
MSRRGRSFFVTCALLLACAAPRSPAPARPAAADPSDELRPALERAEALGLELYRQDRAARRATDALRATPNARPDGLRGWLVLTHPEGRLVRFVVADGDGFASRYDVVVRLGEGESVSIHEPPVPLAENEAAKFRARQLAIDSMARHCTPTYDAAVLEEGGELLVYLMPASSSEDEIVLAGFDRVRISRDGRHAPAFEPLSKSCLVIPRGRDAVRAWVTHVLHPHPIETLVFTSLSYGRALVFGTSTGVWEVEEGEIRWIGPAGPEK